MPRQPNGNSQAAAVELDCSGCEIKFGSMKYGGPEGPTFRSILGPLTEEVAAALERAAQCGAPVRLVFPKTRLEFERIEISRADPGWFQLVGEVRERPF